MREYRPKQPCTYILASKMNGVLYTGVTSDLPARVSVHKQDLMDGFTKRYGVHRLVYFEMFDTMEAAIRRETQIKKWKRAWKVRLIQAMNPQWSELFDEHTGELLDPRAEIGRFSS